MESPPNFGRSGMKNAAIFYLFPPDMEVMISQVNWVFADFGDSH